MARQMRRSMAATPSTTAARRPALRPMLQPQLGQRGRGLGQFITEVRAELRKVVWPTRREAANLTALVIGISVVMGVVLGLFDYAFSELFRLLLR